MTTTAQISSRPLLTIAIPTYNRVEFLHTLLTELHQQLVGEDRIELIISDNASSDNTPILIAKFMQRGMNARYIRNAENIGSDANFLQCFEQALGKYVWIFGDDDVPVSGALRRVRLLLESGDYDLVYLTPHGYIDKEQLRHLPESSEDAIHFTSAISYARKVKIMFTFISSNIINKDNLKVVNTDNFKEFIGTNLIQLSWTYSALNRLNHALYVSKITVLSRSDNSGGYGICRVMGVNLSNIARKLIDRKQVVRILENASLREYLPHYLVKMKNPNYTLNIENSHEVLAPHFGRNINYWIFDYPIIKLPYWFAKIWLLGCRIGNKVNRVIYNNT